MTAPGYEIAWDLRTREQAGIVPEIVAVSDRAQSPVALDG
jgi:hypothetical protein